MISFCKIFYVSFIELLVLLYSLYRYFMGSDPERFRRCAGTGTATVTGNMRMCIRLAVTPLVGVWIEIEEHAITIGAGQCHSPCGSVD